EERQDLAFHDAACRAKCAYGTSDEIEGDRLFDGVEFGADFADAPDLGGPFRDVRNPNEPGVECQIGTVARPSLEDRRHEHPPHGQGCGPPDPVVGAMDERTDGLPIASRDMPARQRVVRAVAFDETSEGADVVGPLMVAQTCIATTDRAADVRWT